MLKIVIAPDPMLRQVCEPCEVGDKGLKRLAKQMAHIMYKYDGCGLAGSQVGVLQRIVVIDCDTESKRPNPICLINPVVVETKGDEVVEREGCLSVPGISVPISRPPFAKVEYYDLEGNKQTIEGDGLLGRCLQHEIDHLDGRTMFESCDPAERIDALRAYKVAQQTGARPGETGEE